MSESLPPFSGDNPTCPKCGNEGASTTWMAYGRIDDERITLGNPDLWPERLHRECRRCSYSWGEAIVSSPASTLRAQVLDWLKARSMDARDDATALRMATLYDQIAADEHLKANADV